MSETERGLNKTLPGMLDISVLLPHLSDIMGSGKPAVYSLFYSQLIWGH